MSSLLVAKGKMISAEPKFDWIAQRSAANHLNLRSIAEPHLQQPPAKFRIAPHGNDESAATDPQLIQSARASRP
jgi:hypothetical protein